MQKNHSVKWPMQSSKIFEAGRKTKLKKYGNKNFVNPKKALDTRYKRYNGQYESKQTSEHRKQVCRKNYGSDCILTSDYGKLKSKDTSYKHFGYDSPNSSPIVKQHKVDALHKKYGDNINNVSQLDSVKLKKHLKMAETIEKGFQTKKKNNSFNTSKPENDAFDILRFIFPRLVRQYKSEQYPFQADFFDPDQPNVRFEFQGSWVHGYHPFDKDNIDDMKMVDHLKSKNTPYYNNAVKVWTYGDPLKRDTAKKNGITLIEFWNVEDVRQFVIHFFDNKQSAHRSK